MQTILCSGMFNHLCYKSGDAINIKWCWFILKKGGFTQNKNPPSISTKDGKKIAMKKKNITN